MDSEALKLLLELGLTPVDWVSDIQFSKLTGIAENKLNHRRKKWPEDKVWAKQDGNIYYSVRGYNQWMTEQAQNRYLRACGSEMVRSKSTGNDARKSMQSRSRIPQMQKVSVQPLKLEAS